MQGSTYFGSPYWYYTALQINSCAYVEISGISFVLDNAGFGEARDAYTLLAATSNHVTVSHCSFGYSGSGTQAYAVARFDADSTDCTVDACFLSGASNCTMYLPQGINKLTFTNNIFWNYYGISLESGTMTNCKVYNNVFKNGEFPFRGGTLTGNTIANNVFYSASNSTIGEGNTFANNAYLAGTPVSETDFTVTDPGFTNADGGDFSLKADSPLIGAGSSEYMPKYDYLGRVRITPADVGAYTYKYVKNAVYYVNGSVEASGNGSETAPFKTVAEGVAQLVAGDTLIIKEGTYNEALSLVDIVGTASNPITIKAEGNVTLEGSTYDRYWWKDTALSVIRGAYINITGIDFVLNGGSGECYTFLIGASNHVNVSHCSFSYSGTEPYATGRIDSNCTDCTLDSCYLTGAGYGMYVPGGLNKITLTNNIFTNWAGMNLENGKISKCTIENNVFVGSGGAFYGGSVADSVVANNVFYSAGSASIGEGNTFANNAYTAGTPVSETDFTVEDPGFTDAANGDFSLKADSPLIGAGSSEYMPERDYTGKLRRAPADVGAYAYGSVYYVDGSVDASGDGSEASPFKTVAEGVAAVAAGDLLIIKAGAYNEALSLVDMVGTASAPITIRAEGKVTLEGSTYDRYWWKDTALSIIRGAYINITGIDFVLNGGSGECYTFLVGASNHVNVSHCTFNYAEGARPYATGRIDSNCTDCTMDSCYFTGADYSMYLSGGLNKTTLTNNIFTNWAALNLESSAVSECTIENNVFVGSGGAFYGGSVADSVVANNVFYSAGSASIGEGNTFTNNAYTAGTPVSETDFTVEDPGFTDAANGDFSLAEGSPLIGAGSSAYMPKYDYTGALRKNADVGAYAYNKTSTAGLEVLSKSPNGSAVMTTIPVKVTFSAPVDMTVLNAKDYIIVTKGTEMVTGSYSIEGSTVTFTPAAEWEYETQYTVKVKASTKSEEGMTLGNDVSWSFTTEQKAVGPREYYVAENGSDDNPGTIDAPIRNASILVNKLKAGDTVIYRQGTYDGIFVMQYKDFSDGAPVTFRSYEGEEATLTSSNGDYIFFLGHVRNVRFENLTFAAYPDATSPRGPAIDIVNFAANHSIRTGEITVTNCKFTNCAPAVRVRDCVTSGRDLKMGAIEISNNVITGTLKEKIGSGIFFWECRVEDGSYAKVYNNVIINSSKSLYFFGRSENLLFYNNTCLDSYDQLNAPGEYDIYAYGGAYNKEIYKEDLFHNCVFKNNIFTKPIRIQKEYDTTVLEAQQNNIFDYNVYASDSMKNYVTYGGGGEGPQMSFAELQQYKGWYGEGAGEAVLGYEANGVYAPVEFVDVKSDGRLSGSDNPAIGAAADTIVEGVPAPATDITGAARTKKEAGAYAFDPTMVFVGENPGEETGSSSKPYTSVSHAVAAGGTNIVVKPGAYEEDGVTIPAGTTVKPYGENGSVVLNGAVAVNGGSVSGVVFSGAVTVSGSDSELKNDQFKAALKVVGAADSLISSNDIQAGLDLSGDTGTTVENNVISGTAAGVSANASTGLKLYNNTFVNNTKDLQFTNASATVRNNIFSAESTVDGGTVDSDYNCYSSVMVSEEYFNAAAEANSIWANPEFVNAKAGDYRLHKLSACVGAGASDEDTPAVDKNGVARTSSDIGAYTMVKVENVYYVSTEGSDDAAGTQDAPFRTIAKAVSVLRAGEKVIVMDGEYTENLSIIKSYDEADSFVISAQNAGKVTVNGNVAIVDSSNVTVSGINVNNTAGNVAVVVNNSTGIKLDSASVSAASGNGIQAADSELTLSEMKILVPGVGLTGSASVMKVTRTLFKGNTKAISSEEASDLLVTASVFSTCGSGIYSVGESALQVINNSFWNVSGLNVDVTQQDGSDTELNLYNNAYSRSGSADSGLFVAVNKAHGFNSENNIYNVSEADKIMSVCGEARTLAEMQNGGDDTASLLGDPMYTAPEADNFSPAKGSQVARAGRTDANAPAISFNGLAFADVMDIGAYYSPFTLRTFHVCPYGIAWSYYGNDPADGSWDRPFATLQQALAVVGSSDTIIVHKGVYDAKRIDIVDLHGTEDARITIKGCDNPDCWYCQKYDSNNFDYAPDEAVAIVSPCLYRRSEVRLCRYDCFCGNRPRYEVY